jgi:hypothetical protein
MHQKLLALCALGAALAVAAAPARAEQDSVQFFHDIHSTADAPVHDAVCFFCSVDVDGKVEGDIVAFFGDVRLNGQASHDVVDFFGSIRAADNSSIGGDMVSMFGSIRLGENVSVRKDMVAVLGSIHAPASASAGGDSVAISPWVVLGPLLVIVLAIVVIVYEVRDRHMRRYARNYPMPPPHQ